MARPLSVPDPPGIDPKHYRGPDCQVTLHLTLNPVIEHAPDPEPSTGSLFPRHGSGGPALYRNDPVPVPSYGFGMSSPVSEGGG
jgi:hypothetical protein